MSTEGELGQRLLKAAETLRQEAADNADSPDGIRLRGKREGVLLAFDYLRSTPAGEAPSAVSTEGELRALSDAATEGLRVLEACKVPPSVERAHAAFALRDWALRGNLAPILEAVAAGALVSADRLAEAEARADRLAEALDRTSLAYIEASNPGINMDRVRAFRAGIEWIDPQDCIHVGCRGDHRADYHDGGCAASDGGS